MNAAAKRWLWWTLAALLLCGIVVFAAREPIEKALTARIAGVATGTSVSIGGERVGLHSATLTNVVLTSSRGEPVARIPNITVTYDLRDALGGGHRRFGLRASMSRIRSSR